MQHGVNEMQSTMDQIEARIMTRLEEFDAEIARSHALIAEFEEHKKKMEEKRQHTKIRVDRYR